jgi:hypothetical protein
MGTFFRKFAEDVLSKDCFVPRTVLSQGRFITKFLGRKIHRTFRQGTLYCTYQIFIFWITEAHRKVIYFLHSAANECSLKEKNLVIFVASGPDLSTGGRIRIYSSAMNIIFHVTVSLCKKYFKSK